MRLIHISDVHLDRSFAGLSLEESKIRRGEVRNTFSRCLQQVEIYDADCMTIGGDLWEDEHVTANTRNEVSYELGKLDIPVLMICGNHDPYIRGGPYDRTNWSDNVYLLGREGLEKHVVGDVSIWGVSWTGGQLSPECLSAGVQERDKDEKTNVLLLHGTHVENEYFENESKYCPVSSKRIAESGFDLCLAGHIHSAGQKGILLYPGSPEPLRWGENGRHCVAVVDIEDGNIEVSFIDINENRYEEIEVDCSGAESGVEILDRIQAARPAADKKLMLQVALHGEISPDCEVDVSDLKQKLSEYFRAVKLLDETRPAYDLEKIASQPTVEGYFVKELKARISEAVTEEECMKLELAILAGLRSLNGHKRILDVD